MHRQPTELYRLLLAAYGSQHWWPAQTEYEMMVGAILTQNISWKRVEQAIANLGQKLTPEYILAAPDEDIISDIRPAGYFTAKTRYLKNLTRWYKEAGCDLSRFRDSDPMALRRSLLAICGVGRETADSIVLYGAELPVFVIDAYTKRLMTRLGYKGNLEYDRLRQYFEQSLPRDAAVYQELHALIVRHCSGCCKAKPLCAGCPLEGHCPTGIGSAFHCAESAAGV